MALILTDVACDYAEGTTLASRALTGVSMTLERGDLAVVLGPTGAGKTTLLRAAAGLLTVVAGSVTVDGVEADAAGAERGAVGLVFQRPEAQFFALSVEEDCAFGPRNLGRSAEDARSDARDALASVGLDPETFGPREPWGLSGGEARRAALAGILAMRPRYLLFDEPTAGLDAHGRESVVAAIATARRDAGVLVVTHDPDLFLAQASAAIVLAQGRSVYSGDVPGLLRALPSLAELHGIEPPEVVRVQMLAEERGVRLEGPYEIEPVAAARRLAAAMGGDAA